MGQFFPFFRVTAETAAIAMGLAIALGLVAALPPAVSAYRLKVIEALRRVV